MDAWHQDARATIYHGDCLEVLRALPNASVDAVVTDPPYGLEFMGKEWDAPWKSEARAQSATVVDAPEVGGFQDGNGGNAFSRSRVRTDTRRHGGDMLQANQGFQSWCEAWAAECLRVLKPGGHLLAFGGTRTWHRLACAIEDAGFEVRDSIAWMYGSGFPKSLDVSKAIDKAAGAERTERVDPRWADRYPNGNGGNHNRGPNGIYGAAESVLGRQLTTTDPVTDAAREWSGWGTALKPAHEPIVVARKPLVGTVAANVLEHGTGALNIDACRIAGDPWKAVAPNVGGRSGGVMGKPREHPGGEPHNAGRWPANVVLDEDQAAELDRQSGVSTSSAIGGKRPPRRQGSGWDRPCNLTHDATTQAYGDHGGASRFFYVAKAPARERPKVDGTAHPTVKPLTLMRWLCRLVTPPDGVILEPFAGSGTTIEAALLEGFRVVAIEREADYLPLIQARLDRVAATEPEDEQLTLDASA